MHHSLCGASWCTHVRECRGRNDAVECDKGCIVALRFEIRRDTFDTLRQRHLLSRAGAMPLDLTRDSAIMQCTACARSAVRQSNGARTQMQARRTRGRASRRGGSERASESESLEAGGHMLMRMRRYARIADIELPVVGVEALQAHWRQIRYCSPQLDGMNV